MRPPQELLYESESSLRLVDKAIEELSATNAELDHDAEALLRHVMAQPGGLATLSNTLLRAYAETAMVVSRLREAPGMLHTGSIDKLQQMHHRLRAVSSTTETATTDILDSLSRATSLVEELDAPASLSDARRHEMAVLLREQLSGVSNQLQFQDITSQQLVHIAALLADMRSRLCEVVAVLEPDSNESHASLSAERLDAKDPWTGTASESQLVADEIFDVQAARKLA